MTDKENISEFKMSKGYLEEKVSTAPATEKLDAVLNYLNDNRNLAYHNGYGLPRNYNKPKDTYLSSQDVLNALDKLERDNMVRMKMMGDGNGNDVEHYCISLDGEVLLQDGGYTKKLENDNVKIRHMKIKDSLLLFFAFLSAAATLGLFLLGLQC